MEIDEQIRRYKDRLRIFLILLLFSAEITNGESEQHAKVFRGETRIQKIDFLLRYPDYLSYELLILAEKEKTHQSKIKHIVKTIFKSREPELKKLEMERFFFGAYEDIDDTISFLKSVGFIDFRSKRRTDMKAIEKTYFITKYALDKSENKLSGFNSFKWYIERCELIKEYFGDLSGTQLKAMQYEIEEYKETILKTYIKDVQEQVRIKYEEVYGEPLL
ncbi:MAG: hypothetical protein EA365_00070 [Gloeocapsa sp. DLM2.Bin57]|nr:MAG: hypothetical protein EA365_00070 [Gloeocapsa sp. DLM2.Bin57]